MGILESIYNGLLAFSSWYWGIPIIIILVIGGIYLTTIIRGVQFTQLGPILKRTFKNIFSKDEAELKKKGITPLQSVFQAMGTTIGTGNIVGVASAIAIGGPGALFWMWVCGFLAMAIKYSEVLLSVKYREKNTDTEGYKAGPFMYIWKGLGMFPLAMIFGCGMIARVVSYAASHASAITKTLGDVGIPTIAVLIFLLVWVTIQILGGLKIAYRISDVIVPFMTVAYIILAISIIIINIGNIGPVFASIFKGAFTGTAAMGGFTGATFALAMRQGLARGVFSNDAGCGSQSLIHAQADFIEDPAQQGSLAIFETFIDTIVVCTMTGLMILFTGDWATGASGQTLALDTVAANYGNVGKIFMVVAIFLFALTSLNGICNSVRFHALTYFKGNKKVALGCQILYFVLVGVGCLLPSITAAFAITDVFNGLCLTINMFAILYLRKQVREATDNYFGRPKKDVEA